MDLRALVYDLRFRVQFLEARGLAFQDLFNSIMSKLHPADFMPCRPWGAIGDRKNDGYLKSERTMFQVYAPNEISLAETLGKIERDFAAALPYWGSLLDAWIFVHNAREGLAPDVIKKLVALGRDHAPLRVEQWGYEELLLRFHRLPPEALQALYGSVPDDVDRSGDVLARHLGRLIEDLARQPLAPMEQGGAATGAAVRVELLAQVQEELEPAERLVRRLAMEEVMKREPRLIIVGPGGSGKTTALRRTAFEWACAVAADPNLVSGAAAGNAVPVLLRLSRYSGSLVDSLAAILMTDAQTTDAILRQGRILLFLDDFDQLPQKRRLLEDLEQLRRLAPGVRLVVASRPDPALAVIPASTAVCYGIAPLGDAELEALFALHLGAVGAEALLRGLEDQELLDPFRLPVMAWLATVEFREFGTAPRRLARGVLYQRILGHLLRKWSLLRREDLVDRSVDLKMECLESLAREMVKRDVVALARSQAVSLFAAAIGRAGALSAGDAGQLLEEVTSESILEGGGDAVEFRHLSLRDHFAAAWLARRASPWRVALLARDARWQEPMLHLVGMLDEARTRAVLQVLLKLTPVAVRACSIDSMRWSADWVFLVLRCLVETPQPVDDLRDRFLDQIRHRAGRPYFFLGRASRGASSGRYEYQIYQEFDSLLGRLGTRASFEYVRSRADRRSRVAGVGHFRNEEGAAVLLEGFAAAEDRDGIADQMAAECLLEFPASLLLSTVETFLVQAEPAAKARLLRSLSQACREDGARSRDFSRLTPLLVAAVLAHDAGWGDAALSFLRRDGAWLTQDAERRFLEVLAEDEREKRYLAIWPLVYARSAESLAALVHALGDDELMLGLRALDALRIRDDEHFPDHVTTLLKRHATGDTAESIAAIVARVEQPLTVMERATFERFLWLALAACSPIDDALRSFCVRSLGRLAMDTSPVLVPIFENDESPLLRESAVGSLAEVLGNDAAPYLIRGLSDPDRGVREMAAHCCRSLTGEAAESVLPLLGERSAKA